MLVGWSVIRLVKSFAQEPNVSEALLMCATAGHLHIGLTEGLVMSALETIQPTSVESLNFPSVRGRAFLQRPKCFRRLTTSPSFG